MASLDERLQEQVEDENPDEDFGNQQDQAEMEEEYRRRLAAEQRRSKAQQAQQQLVNAATSQIKKSIKKKIFYWIMGLFGSTSPIWGPLLLTLMIAGGFITGCNASTLFRAASLGACEPFIVGEIAQTQVVSQGSNNPGGIGIISDEEGRKFLADHGIGVNKPYPTTSLLGVKQSTLNEAVALKQGCDAWALANGKGACSVTVTGGTEDAHAEGACSHAAGYKLDFATNATLDAYIASNFRSVAPRGGANGGPQWINDSSGADYVKESSPVHWDMLVGCNANG